MDAEVPRDPTEGSGGLVPVRRAVPRPGEIYDPVARALDVIGDRWSLVLVRHLLLGPKGFQELRVRTGIAPRVLSSRLRDLAQQGFVTPFTGANVEAYDDPTVRRMGEILLDATVFRFDGSDLMPGAIGAGAFWTGMIDFVGGASAQEVADRIQDTWASLN